MIFSPPVLAWLWRVFGRNPIGFPIGANDVILAVAGAKIGRGSVLAAGSVVSLKIPEYSMVAGNIAQVCGNRKKSDTAIGIVRIPPLSPPGV